MQADKWRRVSEGETEAAGSLNPNKKLKGCMQHVAPAHSWVSAPTGGVQGKVRASTPLPAKQKQICLSAEKGEAINQNFIL